MTQFARPQVTVNNPGGWSQVNETTVWGAIDESSSSDSDYAYGPNNTAAMVEIGLTAPTDPSSSSNHVIRWRYAKSDSDGAPIAPSSGGNAVALTIELYQGSTLIATALSAGNAPNSTFSLGTYTLSAAEADAITNYANLRIRLTQTASGGSPANRKGVAVSWIVLEVPDAGPSAINLNASPIATPLLVPTSSLGFGALSLNASPIAAALAVPASSLNLAAPEINLSASPIAVVLGAPAGSLSHVLSLTASPIATTPAVPAAQLGHSLALSASPIAVVLAVPTSSAGAVPPITLEATPIAVVLDAPAGSLSHVLTLAASAIPATPAVPGSTLSHSLALVATPIPATLTVPTSTLGSALPAINLDASPIGVVLALPGAQLGHSLNLSAAPIAAILAVPSTTLQGGAIISGSDVALIEEMIAYWAEYDALTTDAERIALQRNWLLRHGARRRRRYGIVSIEGGLYPVRFE